MAFDVRTSNDNIHLYIEYTLWSYDLIDKDIDMDELQYTHLCNHFRKWLHSLLKQSVYENGLEVSCQENIAIFRNKVEFLSMTKYSPSVFASSVDEKAQFVKVVKEMYEKCI
jgi:hypothetical protein